MISLQKNRHHSFLEKTIKSLRKELIQIGTREGLTSEKTIKISQKLDIFIAEYQYMKIKEKTSFIPFRKDESV